MKETLSPNPQDPEPFGIVVHEGWLGSMAGSGGFPIVACLIFGVIALIIGLIMLIAGFINGSSADREVSITLAISGAVLMLIGKFLWDRLDNKDAETAGRPTTLLGVFVKNGDAKWGTCSAHLVEREDPDRTRDLRDFKVESSRTLDSTSKLTIFVGPYGFKMTDFHIGALAAVSQGELVGEVICGVNGLPYLLCGTEARPLFFGEFGKEGLATQRCLENLRRIGRAFAGYDSLPCIRLVLASPRENLWTAGVAFGLIGAALASLSDVHSKKQLNTLVQNGGLFDASGTIEDLAKGFGWELLVV